jgi:hypothetical protein
MKASVVLTAAVLAAGGASQSRAQGLPQFDVAAYCRVVAGIGGNYSQMLFGGCMDMEQSSYDALKQGWGQVPQATQQYCLQVARVGGPGSYMLLQGCVQMETAAGRQNQQRQFRY